jgi:periplasmic protein TonB
MKARLIGVAGSVLALSVVGGFAAASTMQTAPAVVQVVQPAVVATVAPTVAPVVVPTTQAPAAVESAPVAAPVVAPKPEVVVPKAAAPAPKAAVAPAESAPAPNSMVDLTLSDGTVVQIPKSIPPINAPDENGSPIPPSVPTPIPTP